MILVYLFAILIHELGHIFFYWSVFKNWPAVRLKKTYVKIIPGTLMTNLQKSAFLGSGIIAGMFAFIPFFYIHSEETAYAMIAYFVACGMDFWNLIKIHIGTIKK